MIADPPPITRDQIAAFVGNDPRAILAIERLFRVAGTLTPEQIASLTEVVDGNLLATGAAANPTPPSSAVVDYLDWREVAPGASLARRARWSDGGLALGLSNAVTARAGQDVLAYVRNASGASVAAGVLVAVAGATGGRLTFDVTDGAQPGRQVLGLTAETIADGAAGLVAAFGMVTGIDATGAGRTVPQVWAVGDLLWLDPDYPGEMTNVEPAAPDIRVAVATVVSASAVFVRLAPGLALDAVYDVNISAPVNGEVLTYSGGVWVNLPGGGGGGGTGGTVALDFGPAPGGSYIEETVVSAPVTAASRVSAWVAGTTADHNATEHALIAGRLGLSVVPGSGQFIIYAATDLRITGEVALKWEAA